MKSTKWIAATLVAATIGALDAGAQGANASRAAAPSSNGSIPPSSARMVSALDEIGRASCRERV